MIRQHPAAGLSALVVVVALLSCGGELPPEPKPTPVWRLEVASGDSQTGLQFSSLGAPLAVRLTADGSPLPSRLVAWSVTDGGGTLSMDAGMTDGQGLADLTWTLGSFGPQSVAAEVAGPNETLKVTFTATAIPGSLILRYDGAQWRTYLADTLAQRLGGVTNLWGADSSSVWAIANGPMHPVSGGPRYHLRLMPSEAELLSWPASYGRAGLSGTSASNVFAATYRPAHSPSTSSMIDRFDGQSWSRVWENFPNYMVWDIWAVPGTQDAFGVGRLLFGSAEAGDILFYNGETGTVSWTTSPVYASSSPMYWLNRVWGVSSNRVFIVGTGGLILQFDGEAWQRQPSSVTTRLNGIHGTTGSNVFAVGDGGTILHFDGSSWSQQPSGTTEHLRAVWAISPTDAFAVGDNSTVLHYDGTGWQAQSVGARVDFHAVWGSSPTFVLASGAPKP